MRTHSSIQRRLVFMMAGIAVLLAFQMYYFSRHIRSYQQGEKWSAAAIKVEFLATSLSHKLTHALNARPLNHQRQFFGEIVELKTLLKDNITALKTLTGHPEDPAIAAELEQVYQYILATQDTPAPLLSTRLLTQKESLSAHATLQQVENLGENLRHLILHHKKGAHELHSRHGQVIQFLSLMVLGLTILAGHYVRNVSRRIAKLADAATHAQAGVMPPKTTIEGDDDLSALAQSFYQVTEKLLYKKQYAENLVQSMGEMFLTVSINGIITQANPAFFDSCACKADEVIGQPLSLFIKTPDFFPKFVTNIRKYGFQKDITTELYRSGETHFPVALSGTAIKSSTGEIEELIVLIKDMTGFSLLLEESKARAAAEAAATTEREKAAELTQLNEELRKSQDQMIEAGKFAAIGEMASGIAHEINNPISIIHGKAGQIKDLLGSDSIEPENRDKILTIADKIETTALRISRVIQSIRSFSQEGSSEPIHPVPIRAILEDALSMCREKFKNHGINLEISPYAPETTLECRGMQISQVILSLLSNAHDAVEEMDHKWIKLDVVDANDWVEFWVTDGGKGINEDTQAKMMLPFYSTKPAGKGSGLGLSVSRNIIETHHGTINLDLSSINTRFIIRLPKTQPVQINKAA